MVSTTAPTCLSLILVHSVDSFPTHVLTDKAQSHEVPAISNVQIPNFRKPMFISVSPRFPGQKQQLVLKQRQGKLEGCVMRDSMELLEKDS